MSVESTFEVPGIIPRAARDAEKLDPPRRVCLELDHGGAFGQISSATAGERTCELSTSRGDIVLTIDRDPDQGYRVWVADLGTCLISVDGDHLLCSPAPTAKPWQLAIAQGLPIAAALQGLEVLHASAVELDGRVIALAAESGTGKTSTALHLVSHGATFFADDVVALEPEDEHLVAHPGIGLAHVPEGERLALVDAGLVDDWPRSSAPKEYVGVPLPGNAAPLAGIYFLRRTRDAERSKISPIDPPDPRLLLGATFVSHVKTPARLLTQLDICSRAARTVRLFSVSSPADGGAAGLAERVVRHAREWL